MQVVADSLHNGQFIGPSGWLNGIFMNYVKKYAAGPPGCQIPGYSMWSIIELPDGLFDPAPCGLGHVFFTVYNPGDCRHGNPRQLGNVFKRNCPPHTQTSYRA